MFKAYFLSFFLLSSFSIAHASVCDIPNTNGETQCNDIFLKPSAIYKKAQACLEFFDDASTVFIDTFSQRVIFTELEPRQTNKFEYETCGEEVYFSKIN